MEYEVDTIDAEIKRLTQLKTARKNAIDRLKNYLRAAMECYQIEKLESAMFKISFRKSEAVEIDDVELLPADCIVIEKKAISKTELKARLKAGEEIEGVRIIENKNIQIK